MLFGAWSLRGILAIDFTQFVRNNFNNVSVPLPCEILFMENHIHFDYRNGPNTAKIQQQRKNTYINDTQIVHIPHLRLMEINLTIV